MKELVCFVEPLLIFKVPHSQLKTKQKKQNPIEEDRPRWAVVLSILLKEHMGLWQG